MCDEYKMRNYGMASTDCPPYPKIKNYATVTIKSMLPVK